MGHIRAQLQIANAKLPELEPKQVEALMDTAATFRYLPPTLAKELKLEATEEREVALADGQRRRDPCVGPVQLSFTGRTCFVGALSMGEHALQGAVPMEDLDRVPDPNRQTIGPHPDRPNVAGGLAMGFQAARADAQE